MADLVVPNPMAHAGKAKRDISNPLTEHASDRIVGAKLASAILAVHALLLHRHIRVTSAITSVAVGSLLF